MFQNGYLNFLPSNDSPLDFDKLAVFSEERGRNTHYVKTNISVKTGPVSSNQTEYSNVTELTEDIYVNTAQMSNVNM